MSTLTVHWKSRLLKWLPREKVRVGRLGGLRSPEPKPFGQANLVALGPEIAQTQLPWLSVIILICYTFWILLLGRLDHRLRLSSRLPRLPVSPIHHRRAAGGPGGADSDLPRAREPDIAQSESRVGAGGEFRV